MLPAMTAASSWMLLLCGQVAARCGGHFRAGGVQVSVSVLIAAESLVLLAAVTILRFFSVCLTQWLTIDEDKEVQHTEPPRISLSPL